VSQTVCFDFEAMRAVDITTVNRAELVDLRDVKVNTALPQREKMIDFIRQVKNPYCYKYKNMVIKSSHAETEATLEDQLERCFVSP